MSLIHPFTSEEIKATFVELGAEKTPGPDYFLILFFQKYWNTVHKDILKLCNDFYNHFTNLEKINWANIILISKADAPVAVFDFRPISLINVALKIISKILATTLSKVIDQLVDKSQLAFINRRYIMDNVVAMVEIMFSMQKKGLASNVVKVDFAKTFDVVEWDFLLELMEAHGFGMRWSLWIASILFSS